MLVRTDDQPVTFRAAKSTDLNFLLSSWLRSYRQSPVNAKLANQLYFKNQERTIRQLLNRGFVVVACTTEDPDQIVGWLCAESRRSGFIVHWLYVKQLYRRLGVARALLQNAMGDVDAEPPIFCSHVPAGNFVEHVSKKLQIVYDPQLKD